MSVMVSVCVPSLLAPSLDGQTESEIEATTLQEALLFPGYPNLRTHIYAQDGTIRKHVLIFYNGQNVAFLDSLNIPLVCADEIRIVQAVSGG